MMCNRYMKKRLTSMNRFTRMLALIINKKRKSENQIVECTYFNVTNAVARSRLFVYHNIEIDEEDAIIIKAVTSRAELRK